MLWSLFLMCINLFTFHIPSENVKLGIKSLPLIWNFKYPIACHLEKYCYLNLKFYGCEKFKLLDISQFLNFLPLVRHFKKFKFKFTVTSKINDF